jgi:hypothetical protein
MNAAPIYRRAFALIPEKDQKEYFSIREEEIAQRADNLMALLERGRSALEELHRGAQLAACDWEFPLSSSGFMESMQVHGKARQVAILACLRAAVAFQEGRDSDAFEDLLDVLVLARHIGTGGLYVYGLVQFAIEQTVIGIASPFVPRQAPATLAAAMARLDAKPPPISLPEAAQAEKAFFLATSPAEFREVPPDELPDTLQKLYSPARAEAILAITGGDQERLFDLVAATAPRFDDLAAIYRLPWADIEPALAAFCTAHETTNPFALVILEQAERLRPGWEKATVFRALFRAALAVAWGGDEQLGSIQDPFGDGPFAYQAVAGGFELESRYQSLVFDGAERGRRPTRIRFGSSDGGR